MLAIRVPNKISIIIIIIIFTHLPPPSPHRPHTINATTTTNWLQYVKYIRVYVHFKQIQVLLTRLYGCIMQRVASRNTAPFSIQ